MNKRKTQKKNLSNVVEQDSHSLAEYKELRAEIRHYLDRRSNNLNFMITITLGVIGVGYQFNNYILFFSATVLVWILWFDEIRRIRGINKTSSYIEIVIEKNINGLYWETLASQNNLQKQILGRLVSNASYPFLYLMNSVIGILIVDKTTNFPVVIKLTITFPFLLMFIILVIASIKVSMHDRQENIDEWKRILKDRNSMSWH